jgi:hypothetical protein
LEQAEQSMKLAVNLAMKRLRRLSPCAAASDRSMPADILIALLGFAFATSITPGPNNILVMASSLNHSVARTIPVVLGISAGFAFMLLAVGIGLGAAIRVNASLNTATKAFGFAYTLWLAWKVATSAPTLRGFRQRRETGVGIHGRDVPVGQPVCVGFRVLGGGSLHRDGRAVCQSRLDRIDLSRGGDFIAQRVGRVRQLYPRPHRQPR